MGGGQSQPEKEYVYVPQWITPPKEPEPPRSITPPPRPETPPPVKPKSRLKPGEPWRKKIDFTEEYRERLMREVSEHRPPGELEVSKTNILLVGKVGAGKSSFLNTVDTVCRREVTTSRAKCGQTGRSLTGKFRRYTFKHAGERLGFRLCDTMGLEEESDADDINFIATLNGHVPDGYKYNPIYPIRAGDQGHIANPQLQDKIHVVCFVIDGSGVSLAPQSDWKKLQLLRRRTEGDIPVVALMTKVDRLDIDDLKNTFTNEDVIATAEQLAENLGVNLSSVVPVKNYEKETELELAMDILALTALREMLCKADMYFDDILERQEDNKPLVKEEEVPEEEPEPEPEPEKVSACVTS